MKYNEFGVFKIGEHWITAIEYGDFTGLTKGEIEKIKSFLSDLPENSIFNYEQDSDFTIDCVSGMYAMCVTAKVVYFS